MDSDESKITSADNRENYQKGIKVIDADMTIETDFDQEFLFQ